MNLGEIISNVNAELSPPTSINILIRRWANKAQHQFLLEANHKFSWLVLNGLSFSTVASQSEYALPALVDTGKLIVLTERSSPRKIEVITRERFFEQVPDPTSNVGTPKVAYLSGFAAVTNQPTSTSVLSLVSSAADNAVIKIEGLNASGVFVGEEITLSGTTPVSSINSYSRILSRSVNSFLTGVVTITSNSGAVTNVVIGPRQRQGIQAKIVLWPTPAGAETYYYDAQMRLPDLVNDNDFSYIPEEYHEAIEHYCLYRGYNMKSDPAMASASYSMFRQVVAMAVQADKGPRKTIQMQDRVLGRDINSNLPGNFPRGV